MMQRSFSRHRPKIILVIGALVIWWSLSMSFDIVSRSEFTHLQRLMNNGKHSSISLKKSSFDWSSVSFRYPAGALKPLPAGRSRNLPPVQANFPSERFHERRTREERQREVKRVFLNDWKAYKSFAWMKDALKPLSESYRDQFSGWSATLVDSLDALWIMGLREEFDEAVEAVAQIDFGTSTSTRVNTFETNIRYLGGLIAAYDLSKREILLTKAVELGDLIYGAFNTENRMPVDFIDFKAAKTGKGLVVEGSVVSASPGTLSLELTRLSQLTGDPKYYDAISRVMDVFYQGQKKTMLPGLWPMFVSMSSQDVVSGNTFTLAGCADSLYEYLPKVHALLGGQEHRYEEMTANFVEAGKRLFFRPMVPNNESILIPSSGRVTQDGRVILDEETEHLACYIGGTYALAGRLLGAKEYVNIGEKLALGCVYGYKSFPTGMMPERVNMVACESIEDCEWNETRFDKEKIKRREWKDHLPLGFTTAKDPRYILRPEAIESVFILYRITGDPAWQEIGWDMFTAIVNGTKTETGTHAAVQDVTRATDDLPKDDYMESFWLAETLKYFYLLFSTPDIINLNDYVLNTEAHPFLRSK
ncbi:endoplasmic reticulum mannosyl-oligosaccharide 1,2-alpha-mannosidase [Biscogniauxia mediterranea]|nr:endoplasmic reticulum mannosyl-oligosaccharide 1,2-alpha-mannosidase [Biscogniauxia mediterranea]